MSRINFLPPWVETNEQPAFYDKESGTVLQQTARMYAKVNQLVRSVNEQNETIADYIQQFIDLHEYVEDYFENLDVQQEINHKLDEMVLDGSFQTILNTYVEPKLTALDTKLSDDIDTEASIRSTADASLQAQITGLASGSPLVASDVSEMTDTTKVYVNTTDGKWYYYDGDSWEIGGTYQSSAIADNTITEDMLSSNLKASFKNKVIDKDVLMKNGSITLDLSQFDIENHNITSGVISPTVTSTRACNMVPIYVPANCYIKVSKVNSGDGLALYYYKTDGTYLYEINSPVSYVNNCVPYPRLVHLKFSKANASSDIPADYVIANYGASLHSFNNNNLVNYKIGNNLFDASTAVEGLVGSVGTIEASDSYKTSQPIKLNAGTTYHFSKFRRFMLYDEDMQWDPDSYINANTSNYSITPEDDCYAVFSVNNADIGICMVNSGDDALPYEPYIKELDGITNSGYITGNIACLGDSIMYGDGSDSLKGLAKSMRDDIGFALSANYSRGGATIHYVADVDNPRLNITAQADELVTDALSGINYIFICGMMNDYGTATLGTLTEGYETTPDKTTFIGGLEYIFKTLKTAYPDSKIVFVRPHNTGSRNYNKQIQFGDALLETASKYAVPVVDVYKDGTMNTNFASMYKYSNPTVEQPLGDRTHPTNEAYSKFYIPLVRNMINKIG